MIERHIITGEYPPGHGGVADYTANLAQALAAAGERVHVWAPGQTGDTQEGDVIVHRSLDALNAQDLRAVDTALARYNAPRRLLVQWVPHAFGRRGLNLEFCRWLRRRVIVHRDVLEAIVHEPFLGFAGGLRHRGAALIQRVMARVALGRASRILVTTPQWQQHLKRYVPGIPFDCVPVPSGIPVTAAAHARVTVRREHGIALDAPMVGSFGSTGPAQADGVAAVLDQSGRGTVAVVVGLRSGDIRSAVLRLRPEYASRVIATGAVSAQQASDIIAAVDVMVQPYPDGICGRHSSAAAVLAHGVPMVTTIGPFTESFWAGSGAVALAPVGDREALARAAGRLIADEGARASMSAAARALYEERFHVRHTVSALQKWYTTCASPS